MKKSKFEYNGESKTFNDILSEVSDGREVEGTVELSPWIRILSAEEIEEIIISHSGSLAAMESFVDDVILLGREVQPLDNPKSFYCGKDYFSVCNRFMYLNQELRMESPYKGRRQHNFNFGEKLCMEGFQYFPDTKMMIVKFRSCDMLNKFPFDAAIMYFISKKFCVDVKDFCFFFGSAHMYIEER